MRENTAIQILGNEGNAVEFKSTVSEERTH